jgi:ferredoxin
MKLVVNWPLCDGNGLCVGVAPELFELDADDNLVVLVEDVTDDLLAKAQAAVRVCPKQALSIEKA